MSIANEISRITSDRNALRTKLVDLGVVGVTSTSNLDTITAKVNAINNSTASATSLNCGASATIPVGYVRSAITISANALSGQTSGTAEASDIYTGKTAWVNGTKVTGSMGDGVLSATLSANTGGSASMAGTGITTTTTAGSYYVTLSTTAGSVTPKAGVTTAGKVTTSTTKTGSATAVSVSGNDTKLYITPSTTGDVVAATATSPNVTLQPGEQVTISKGYYNSDRIISAEIADDYTEATPASGLTIAMTDRTAGVTIGTLTNGNYPVSVSQLEATINASTPGWLAAQTTGIKDTDGGRVGVIPAAALTATATKVSDASVTSTATGFTPATSNTGVYVTLTNTNGSARATAGVGTAGYAPTSLTKTSTSNASVGVTYAGEGSTIYIPSRGAQTYTPSTSDVSVPAGAYLTAASTIKAVNFDTAASTKALASDILSDKTVKIVSNNTTLATLTGTMVNNGAVAPAALNCGQSYTIPQGYHSGAGTVTAASLASQTSATATPSDILSTKTAWVNGAQLTGSLTVNNYYTGNTEPDSSLGSEGDFYFMI